MTIDKNDPWHGVEITDGLLRAMDITFPEGVGSSQPIVDINVVNFKAGQGSVTAFLRGKKLQAERKETETDE